MMGWKRDIILTTKPTDHQPPLPKVSLSSLNKAIDNSMFFVALLKLLFMASLHVPSILRNLCTTVSGRTTE